MKETAPTVYKQGEYSIPVVVGNFLNYESTTVVNTERPYPRGKHIVALWGSAGDYYDLTEEEKEISGIVGRELAKRDIIAVNGACNGNPHFGIEGSRKAGGYNVGLSARATVKDPEYFDILIYVNPGIESASRRDTPRNAATRDWISSVYGHGEKKRGGAILLGGFWGTNDEYAKRVLLGHNVIGVLDGTDGITERLIPAYETMNPEKFKDVPILKDKDPVRLVERVEAELVKRSARNGELDLTDPLEAHIARLEEAMSDPRIKVHYERVRSILRREKHQGRI